MNAYQVLTTADAGTPDWLAAHKGAVGGSGVADVLGYGRNTPLKRWALWTGRIEPEDISQLPHVKLGNYLEPAVCGMWSAETNRALLPSPGVLRDGEFAWLVGTPDRLIEARDNRPMGIMEAKTANRFMASEWETDVPVAYRIQLHVYMRIMGLEWGSFGAIIGGGEFLWKDEVRSDTFLDFMMNTLVDFYEKFVRTDTPPPATWGDTDAKTIKAMFPRDSGEVMQATPEILRLTKELEELEPHYTAAKDAFKVFDDQREEIRNTIKLRMGAAAAAMLGDGTMWSLPTSERAIKARVDIVRSLTRKKVK